MFTYSYTGTKFGFNFYPFNLNITPKNQVKNKINKLNRACKCYLLADLLRTLHYGHDTLAVMPTKPKNWSFFWYFNLHRKLCAHTLTHLRLSKSMLHTLYFQIVLCLVLHLVSTDLHLVATDTCIQTTRGRLVELEY